VLVFTIGFRSRLVFAVVSLVALPLGAGSVRAGASSSATCNGRPADVLGTAKADDITTEAFGTVVVAKAGADTISTGRDYWDYSGDVVACGWAGNDTFVGSFGFIDGGGGFDVARLCEAPPGLVLRNVELVVLDDPLGDCWNEDPLGR
jgi:hypothetical protein